MASVFSKIVAGEIPAWKVAEDDDFLAFLDISPLTMGHTLVIPKNEVDYLFDIDSDEFSRLFLFARKVALGIKEAVPCKRIGVAVLGMEVPHAHIHLVPLNKESDMDLSRPKLKPERSEMEQIAKLISSKIKL
ncbi:putative HIT-like protein [bioreactor metagenome]|uniref:Putative HIT-like protein n=1 Tax=bioreactor metagenome TaxID=1076179 RepID=A0A645CRP4_9ZZZZ|nr:HIT family protein [Rikenellaceae bacterium]